MPRRRRRSHAVGVSLALTAGQRSATAARGRGVRTARCERRPPGRGRWSGGTRPTVCVVPPTREAAKVPSGATRSAPPIWRPSCGTAELVPWSATPTAMAELQGPRFGMATVERCDRPGGADAGGEGDHVHLGRREVIGAQRQRRCRGNQGERRRCRRGRAGRRRRRDHHFHGSGSAGGRRGRPPTRRPLRPPRSAGATAGPARQSWARPARGRDAAPSRGAEHISGQRHEATVDSRP